MDRGDWTSVGLVKSWQLTLTGLKITGAGGRTRTGTGLHPGDFESASTDSQNQQNRMVDQSAF